MEIEINRCIVCDEPVGAESYIGTIGDMRVIFCMNHNNDCKQNCSTCEYAVMPMIK